MFGAEPAARTLQRAFWAHVSLKFYFVRASSGSTFADILLITCSDTVQFFSMCLICETLFGDGVPQHNEDLRTVAELVNMTHIG